jgi:hypothetical protein
MPNPFPDDRRPIFIGGPHRSGTGMIRAVLGSNSQVAIPPKEYQFFDMPVIAANRDWAADPFTTLGAILQWHKVHSWGLADADPRAMLAGTACDASAIYAAPLRAYAAGLGKPRFGEKTPYLEHHFETLLAWFGPGVRFVHMLRHPLPTFASLCHQYGARQPLDPVRFARAWQASALRGRDYARRFPEQYLLVDYEAFTADPEGWTRQLCGFCGLPDEIAPMLEMRDFARKRNSSFSGDSTAPAIVATGEAEHPPVSQLDRWLIARTIAGHATGMTLAGRASVLLARVRAKLSR